MHALIFALIFLPASAQTLRPCPEGDKSGACYLQRLEQQNASSNERRRLQLDEERNQRQQRMAEESKRLREACLAKLKPGSSELLCN